MLYPDQPTPPFKSPYQHRTGTIMESPYPSPVRHEARSKYSQGLGLYEVQSAFPNGLPPSPQPSEAWSGQYSNTSSSADFANPYLSGAFDHPVSRSPLPWQSAQSSPRSSLSSYTREMSAFSHDGSEHAYSGVVKGETPAWSPQMHFGADVPVDMNELATSRQAQLTVAPERLNTSAYPYENAYTPPNAPKYNQTLVYNYHNDGYERALSDGSIPSPRARNLRPRYTITAAHRRQTRNRRHTDPAHAAFLCELCPKKGFARKYNYNQHMLTHAPMRRKDHVCLYTNCGKQFVRKTDLVRHRASVHEKQKPWPCSKCSSVFARKDTLRR